MKIDLLGEGFDKYQFYAPYIRTLYDALRKKSLISYTGGDLYSYQYIPPKELIQLEEEKKKNKQEGFPISVILSKSFISFSKEISEAKKFFGENKTMLILKKPKLKINNPCNADIREISSYPQEEEVLVFPVCILGIDDINKVGNNYTINLKYLEDYDAVEKRKFENNNNKINNNINNNINTNINNNINNNNINNNIHKEAQNTPFKEVVKKTGLVKEEELSNYIFKFSDNHSEYKESSSKSFCSCCDCCSTKCKIISIIITVLIFAATTTISILGRKAESKKKSTNTSYSTSCSYGYYYDSEKSSCSPCKAGYYTDLFKSECTECEKGTYSKEASSGCTSCPS